MSPVIRASRPRLQGPCRVTGAYPEGAFVVFERCSKGIREETFIWRVDSPVPGRAGRGGSVKYGKVSERSVWADRFPGGKPEDIRQIRVGR